MKKILTVLIFCFFVKQGSAQDSLIAKYNGGCLISGGSITVAEFKKLKTICPVKLTKVIRYRMTFTSKSIASTKEYVTLYEAGTDFSIAPPRVAPGDIIVFDEIEGLGSDKKKAKAKGMTLLFK